MLSDQELAPLVRVLRQNAIDVFKDSSFLDYLDLSECRTFWLQSSFGRELRGQ